MQDYPEVIVHFIGSFSLKLLPTNSVVCFSIRREDRRWRILIGPKLFKINPNNTLVRKLYSDEKITTNIDLTTMAHGSDEDTRERNLPIFVAAADRIHAHFEANPDARVLVNCGHGRSRSGTAVALFMMKYLGYTAAQAITIVTAVLSHRRVTESISIKTRNADGNYGDWLKYWEKNRDQFQPTAPTDLSLFRPRKRRRDDETGLSSQEKEQANPAPQ